MEAVGDIDECSGFMHIIPSLKHNQISIHPEIIFFLKDTTHFEILLHVEDTTKPHKYQVELMLK